MLMQCSLASARQCSTTFANSCNCGSLWRLVAYWFFAHVLAAPSYRRSLIRGHVSSCSGEGVHVGVTIRLVTIRRKL